MLTQWKKNQAQEIAQVLICDGMLFGKELEEFIKLEEVSGMMKFKENEFDEFIEEVIGRVEASWQRTVAIYDLKENITKIYLNTNEACNELGITLRMLYVYKNKGHKLKRRYVISGYKPSIKELGQGLNELCKPRKGCYLKI